MEEGLSMNAKNNGNPEPAELTAEDKQDIAFVETLQILQHLRCAQLGSIAVTALGYLIDRSEDTPLPDGKPYFDSKGRFHYHCSDICGSYKRVTVETLDNDDARSAQMQAEERDGS